MSQKTLTKIGDVTYMSPKSAGDLWGMTHQKVTAECKAGKVIGAIKDSKNGWIIPINATKPLNEEEIRGLLILVLMLKNKHAEIPNTINMERMKSLFQGLVGYRYIEPFDLTSGVIYPGDFVLTDEGMNIATSGKKVTMDWRNWTLQFYNGVGTLASIASFLLMFK